MSNKIFSEISIFISKRYRDNYAVTIWPDVMKYLKGIEYFEIIPGNKPGFLCTLKPCETKLRNQSYKLQKFKKSKCGVVEFPCKLANEKQIGLVGKTTYTNIILNKDTKYLSIVKSNSNIKSKVKKSKVKKSEINSNSKNFEKELREILNTFAVNLYNLFTKGNNNV